MKKIVIASVIFGILLFSACHEFENPIDPYFNLIAYYPLEGNGKNSADVFHNASITEAQLTTGHYGDEDSAYKLSGSVDSCIDCGLIGGLSKDNADGMPSVSVSFWFKRTDDTFINNGNMLGKWEDCIDYGYYVDIENNYPQFEVELKNTSRKLSVSASSAYQDQDWHHMVICIRETCDTDGNFLQTDIRLFIDGVNLGSDYETEKAAVTELPSLRFGNCNPSSDGVPFSIDNIKIFTRYLSAEDVEKLYNETE